MNNAELIVETLRAAGVSHGFGIPSGNVLPLIEAMRACGLPYVLTAHEGSEALEIALSEPLGPVHLDVPEDVVLAPATEPLPAIPTRRRLGVASEASLR